MAVFSSLSIMGPIISSSFSLSSSWMISISLTGSTVPSTWMISSSSKAPAETRHVARRYRISDLFSAGTHQQGQSIDWKCHSQDWVFGLKHAVWLHLKHKIIIVLEKILSECTPAQSFSSFLKSILLILKGQIKQQGLAWCLQHTVFKKQNEGLRHVGNNQVEFQRKTAAEDRQALSHRHLHVSCGCTGD